MPQTLPNPERFHFGLYDSDTGKSLTPDRVIEITDICPNYLEGGCFLLYTNAKRGRLVQIRLPYETGVTIGTSIHFSLDSLDRELRMPNGDNTLMSTANQLGLSGERFIGVLLGCSA
jgi:hypothetical protein